MKFRTALTVLAVAVSFLNAEYAPAAPIVPGKQTLTFLPIQDFILVPGTPFNPGPTNVLVDDVTGFGSVFFDRQAQLVEGGDIQLTNGYFYGTGFHPALGNYEFIAGTLFGFDPLTATLQNVVHDPLHPGYATGDPESILSADVIFNVPNYGANLLDAGVSVEVRDPFFFEGTLDGLPPSNGTVFTANPFTGPASELSVFLVGPDTLIGFSTERRLVMVPEPGSIALGSLGFLAIAAGVRRRRKSLATA